MPDEDVEEVERDVKIEATNLPAWSVEALLHRIHNELGSPDLKDWYAALTIEYQGLDESQYEKLLVLQETLWIGLEIEVVKTRLSPPQKLKEKRWAEVEQERARETQSE